ncbi:ATP-binding cassette domain-containing protein, partial [Rubrimonas cliftonensis]
HAFGRTRALDDVSFSAPRGAFTALLGVNGAGKSTLFNLVTRLFDTQSGEIAVCGHDVRAAPTAALRRLGVVFQSRALDPNLTVAQNIVYHGALHGLGRRAALARGEAVLARVAMAERMGDRVGRLSGGQARRVEIARALLHRPELLLCDEATVGLDVQSRTAIVADVHRLAADEGAGVLWASHLIDEVAAGDRVVVLHKGRVLAEGPAAEVAGGRPLTDAFLALTGAAA